MTDVAAQVPAPPAAPAPPVAAAPPAPGAPSLNAADIAAIAAQVAASIQPGAIAPAPAPEDIPTSPENLFAKGQVVTHTENSPYDGVTTRYGIVVDTLPDEGAGARSVVAWFQSVSGPIGDHLLAAG